MLFEQSREPGTATSSSQAPITTRSQGQVANDAKVMEAGYTWVQVDLRGTGASTGCLDWNGPGEQQDVVTAVEWAAAQPWSNGRVGLFGKSYDGVTGLIAAGNQPRGLAAVVAQEPAMEPYTYLYNNEVPYYNAIGTSLSLSLIHI